MSLDSAIYVDGHRVATPGSIGEILESRRRRGGMAWGRIYDPTEEEFEAVASGFGLRHPAVEDVTQPHSGPRSSTTVILFSSS